MQSRIQDRSATETYIMLAFVFMVVGFLAGISRAYDPPINLLDTIPSEEITRLKVVFVLTLIGFIGGLVWGVDRMSPEMLTRSTVVVLAALAAGALIGLLLADIAPFDLMQALLRGVGITLGLTVFGIMLALAMALVTGILRASPYFIVRFVTSVYVEIFRGTSVLVQLFWIYFVLPLPPFNITISAFWAGVLALGLNVGAYGAEAVRGAIQSVPSGQIEASIALNMSPGLRMRRIILPQAAIRMLPPLGNLAIELLKATALVSLIGLADITFLARSAERTVGRRAELFSLLLIIYFFLAYPMTLGVRWIERQRQWN